MNWLFSKFARANRNEPGALAQTDSNSTVGKNGAETSPFSIIVDGCKFTIFFDQKDINIAPAVAAEQTWEPWQLDLYKLVIEPHFNCVDAGANVGINAVIMAHYAKQGAVHSFEPVKQTRSLLLQNKIANKSHNLVVVGTGLGNDNSNVTISVDRQALGKASIIADGLSADESFCESNSTADTEEISIQRLDDYWAGMGYPAIDFFKIDVEGYEKNVLLGAGQLLQRHKQMLLICEMSLLTQLRNEEFKMGFVGSQSLLEVIRQSFSQIYLMGRDAKLYLVSSYAYLRIMMLNGHPVDDLFCCNFLPGQLEVKLSAGWAVPERLTAECELHDTSSILYINRHVDGWARPSADLKGTRGGAVLSLSHSHRVQVTIRGIVRELIQTSHHFVAVTINDSTKVFDLGGENEEINLSLASGVHFLFVESLFEMEAGLYFNNPADNRRIGVHFTVCLVPGD